MPLDLLWERQIYQILFNLEHSTGFTLNYRVQKMTTKDDFNKIYQEIEYLATRDEVQGIKHKLE